MGLNAGIMRYVTVDELVYINQQVVTGEAIHSIVEGKRAVRDMGLLEAAAARPIASAFGCGCLFDIEREGSSAATCSGA